MASLGARYTSIRTSIRRTVCGLLVLCTGRWHTRGYTYTRKAYGPFARKPCPGYGAKQLQCFSHSSYRRVSYSRFSTARDFPLPLSDKVAVRSSPRRLTIAPNYSPRDRACDRLSWTHWRHRATRSAGRKILRYIGSSGIFLFISGS